MQKYSIPFNKPFIAGKELYYIAQSVIGGHTAGDGVFTKKCQELMERRFDANKILLTHSCTAALEMAALLCNIEMGDEVIMPSFTFVSTANAFFLRGARPVFVDIRSDTLNIDEKLIGGKITDKTKAIVVVHYAGVGCEMEIIMEIARKHNLIVIEDSAQGVNAKYKDKYLGTIGDIGCYSFHETKNVISGEGGAIVLNNRKYIERAEIIREKGTNRSKYFRGEVDKYTWVDIGSSYLPSDILAAFLYAQLENIDSITVKREKIYDFYYRELNTLVNDGYITLPCVSPECMHNSHLFYVLLNDEKTRNKMMDYLKSKSILAVFHYVPLHLSKVGKEMGNLKGSLPVTESLSSRILRLPFYYSITESEQIRVIEAMLKFFKS